MSVKHAGMTKYQDIRVNREYLIRGVGSYAFYPHMIVKVVTQPPAYTPARDFYPFFRVLILKRLTDVSSDAPNREELDRETRPGEYLLVNWRNMFYIDPWSDYGLSWNFENVVLEPLPSDIAAKSVALQELKAIPSQPGFPGGTDFLTLVAARQWTVQNVQGGKTYFKPINLN